MIEDWFSDSLRSFRHRPIYSLGSLKGAKFLSIEPVLRRLELREEMRHVVRVAGSTETAAKASQIKTIIEEMDIPFERDWTSLRCDDELVFAFRSLSDATRFRLIWD